MWNNFSRVLALIKLLYESWVSKQQVFTPLYRGVKIRWNLPAYQIESLKLDQITNDLMHDLVIVLWRINFKSIASLEEHCCRHSCCSCPIADTKQSSGDSGCTLRTIVFFQLSPTNKHPMTSNPFELAIVSCFYSSAMTGVIGSFEQPLKLQFFQLLMIFSSWWSSELLIKSASGDLASDEVLLMPSTSDVLQNHLSSDASSFLLVDSIALICSSRTYALKRH